MKRKTRVWGTGGLLITGLLVVAMMIINVRQESESRIEKSDPVDVTLEKRPVVLTEEQPKTSGSMPVEAKFDPEVAALSDVDIEMRMSGLPAHQDYLDYTKHLEARGWGIPHQTEREYQNFDLETLESMADAGDFIALSALDSKISSNINADLSIDRERLAQVREKAAMFGMTTSSILRGQTLLDEYELLRETPKMDESPTYKHADPRKRVVDGLAWLDFSVYRGDLQALQEMANAVAKPELAITQDELEAAKAESKRIYERLSEQRAERGLPEFDNNLPIGAIRLYEHTLNTPISAAIRNGE